MPLSRRLLPIFYCLVQILFYSHSSYITKAKVILRIGIPFICCLLPIFKCLVVIFFYPLTFGITKADIILRVYMSFICRSLKIYKCPVVILFYSFSIIITLSNVVLRISIPTIRCLLIVVEAVLNIATLIAFFRVLMCKFSSKCI